MQKVYLKYQPVMTYKQWVIEHAKRSLRGKVKRTARKLRKGFVRVWNGTIDGIIMLTHFVSKNKRSLLLTIGTIAAITGFSALVLGTMYHAGETDLFAMGIRTKYGTYQNGYVKTIDGKEWEMIPPNMKEGLLENELVTITFNTNGTEEISDDVVTNVQGWKLKLF